MTVQVDVDFNERGRDGLVEVSQRRADGEFAVGDTVELYDGADPSTRFEAVVEQLDERGYGYARPRWRSAQPSQSSDPWSDVVLRALMSDNASHTGVTQRPVSQSLAGVQTSPAMTPVPVHG